MEISVVNTLYSAEILTAVSFSFLCAVIMITFTISIILYVAYYKMSEIPAFYAAMIPLITAALANTVLVATALR